VRGLLGVFLDLLNWLRIYRQRDFWIQIATVIVGVILWAIIFLTEVSGAIAVMLGLIFLSAIMTNIVWAISKKPYSCVLGGFIGYGLYYLAIAVVAYHLPLADILWYIFSGAIYGFIFSWFAFIIFYFIGLIKISRKKEEPKLPQT